jgi:hypothetical protein
MARIFRATTTRMLLATMVVAATVLVMSPTGSAQGCVVARLSLPAVGPQGTGGHVLSGNESLLSCSRLQVSTNYRTFHSFRHFVGDVEQKQRETAKTQVNNEVHVLDFGATYSVNSRVSLSLAVPLLIAKRYGQSTPQNVTHGRGVGDLTFGVQSWLFEPPSEGGHNIALGFTAKVPTGNPGQTDLSTSSNGTVNTVVVDQSIQPGDGGYGFALNATGYQRASFLTFYGSGLYLFNPKNTNGVLTGRSRASEAIMSVPDQYLFRAGAVTPMPKLRNLALSMGIRAEGVPVRDAFGKSLGFRRPGYTLAADPGLMFARANDEWSLSIPVAFRRVRTRSVSDIMDNRSGDAAFADYQIVAGYSHHF